MFACILFLMVQTRYMAVVIQMLKLTRFYTNGCHFFITAQNKPVIIQTAQLEVVIFLRVLI